VIQRLLSPPVILASETPYEETVDPLALDAEVEPTGLTTNAGGADSHSHTVSAHEHGVHRHPLHTHRVLRQGIFRHLRPGDHVIVAWANTSDPVVIDRYDIFVPEEMP
jgi:hypothetical protein